MTNSVETVRPLEIEPKSREKSLSPVRDKACQLGKFAHGIQSYLLDHYLIQRGSER